MLSNMCADVVGNDDAIVHPVNSDVAENGKLEQVLSNRERRAA